MAAVTSVGFIGAGKMATALARGFIAADGLITRDRITASDPASTDNIEALGINIANSNIETVKNSEMIWIAVKPHHVTKVLKEISPYITPDHLVMSVAAGITLTTMEKNLPENTRLVRCMSNIPVVVQSGVTIFSAGSAVNEEDKLKVNDFLSALGVSHEMDESYMDVITGLVGCGPSYMFMTLDALADGGVWAGIPKELSLNLIAHTMLGAAKMVIQNGKHPSELKDEVCSPAGTSIQAIQVLEKAGLRGLLMEAVQTASKRAAELSRLENGEDYALKRR